MASTANMYRVGDYVYFEINTASPYQIRRIEELNKTPSGNVEAKVMCFYRRRDIGPALLKIIDGRSTAVTESSASTNSETSKDATVSKNAESGSESTAVIEGEKSTPEKMDTLEKPPETALESPDKSESISPDKKPPDEPVPSPHPIADVSPKKSEDITEGEISTEKPREKSKSPSPVVEKTPPPQPGATSAGAAMPGEDKLTDTEKHRLLHRELFLSRQIETLPATHIRGKCTVTLLNELETPDLYLNKEDAFFYSLVYDPAQKTILADKGEIRVGDKYQATVPESVLSDEERTKDRQNLSEFESLMFHPYHGLTDRQIDQFLVVSRAVGTLARAFDMNSATKYAGLHTTVAAASRDVTIFQGMILLHQADYDVAKATSFLVPPAQKQWYPVDADKLSGHTTAALGGPLMVRDQMEEWSAAESNLFEEALEKYGKDFNDIRQDFLPWKSLKDIVEYYYMWKTTDRYIQQKRVKAAEAESRLKQVYIPTYAKPNPNAINAANIGAFKKSCEGCAGESCEQWYAWGPTTAQLRLCKECWNYWKKYGGLKRKHKLETFDKLMVTPNQDTVHGMIMPRPGDRLVDTPDFGGRVQRCSLPGCSMQFANLQTLNQHLRRDHGLPWTGQEGLLGNTLLRPAPFSVAGTAASGTPPLQYGHLHSGPMRNGPRTRAPVFLRTTLFTKAARRLAPKQLLNPRHSARNPFEVVNAQAIKAYCQNLPTLKIQKMARVLVKMGLASASAQAAAFQTSQKSSQPQQQQAQNLSTSGQVHGQRLHGKQGHPNVATVAPIQRQHQMPQKRPAVAASASGVHPQAKRSRETEAAAERGGDALFMKWVNTPDDYYFHRTKKTKLMRRLLNVSVLRKMGRQPYRMHALTAKLLTKYGMI